MVQVVERLVLVAQELLKLGARGRVEGLVGVLVADLPADDVGVVAEAARELGDDQRAELAVARAGVVELAAARRARASGRRRSCPACRDTSCVSHAGGASVGVPMTTAM